MTTIILKEPNATLLCGSSLIVLAPGFYRQKLVLPCAMTKAGTYSPVRSAIVLTLSFMLPLLASLYSDRLSAGFAAFRLSGTGPVAPRLHDAAIQGTPILAQQKNVSPTPPKGLTDLY